jgi:hypothetical protein
MPGSGQDSGPSTRDSFARYDRASRSWRTSRASLLEAGLDAFSGTWPRRGMMRSGACYQLPGSAPPISASAYSSLHIRAQLGLTPTMATDDQMGMRAATDYGFDYRATFLRDGIVRNLASPPTLAGGDTFGDARVADALRGWLDRAEDRTEPSSTRIDPSWAERYMGFPEGWTELES